MTDSKSKVNSASKLDAKQIQSSSVLDNYTPNELGAKLAVGVVTNAPVQIVRSYAPDESAMIKAIQIVLSAGQ